MIGKRVWQTDKGRRREAWYFRVDLGRDGDGHRRTVTRGGFETKRDAEKAMREALGKIDRNVDPFPDGITFAEYAGWWLDHHDVQPMTLRGYRRIVAIWLVPKLGDLRLDGIKPEHVRHCLDAVHRSPATVRQVRAVLGKIMATAVKGELIWRNPVTAVDAPKVARPDLVVPTASQLVQVLEVARGTTWEIPLLLSMSLGTRRGETLAIGWESVDLDDGRVRVVRSLEWPRGGDWRFKAPKSDRGRRTVTLPAEATERLRRWKVEQTQRRLAAGPAWHDHGLVCDRGDGAPIQPDGFTRAWGRLAVKVGLDGARLHDVRHAVATAMLAQGVHPAIASAVLGHSTTAFTMDTYQHVLPQMTDQAAVAIGDALGWSQGSG